MSLSVRQAAFISTARGCGFGALAIVTTMFGCLGNPAMALKVGGLSTLLAAAILILKAWHAPSRPYRKTEVWLLLPEQDRPSASFAQQVIAAARVEAFYSFARITVLVSVALLAAGLLWGILLAD